MGIVSIHTKKRNTYHISLGRFTAEMLGIYDYKIDKLTVLLNNEKPCIRYSTFDDNKSYKLSLTKGLIYFTFTLDFSFVDGLYSLENIGNDIFEIVFKHKH